MFTFSYTRISFITFALFFFSKLSSIIKAFFFLTDKSLSFNLSVRLCFEKGKKEKNQVVVFICFNFDLR